MNKFIKEQINSNEVIRIKSSQVINNCFYLYELILDYQNLLQILNVCDNIKQGYQTLILLFKKQDENMGRFFFLKKSLQRCFLVDIITLL